jgi:DNA ligase-1
MREETPVVFMAFDLLYFDGELLLERPLSERRAALEEFVAKKSSHIRSGFREKNAAEPQASLFAHAESGEGAEGLSRLVLAPAISLVHAEQLEQAYMDARARGNEGVMIKARGSVYQPGRRGLAWLKLKRELATLDVVVTVAEFGHGKRAGILSDYTFAVRDGEKLKNVGKAYSGLMDAEIAELSQFFMEHTIEDSGYVRSVEPILVLEVAFNNVMRSERHASGFALRFPRIMRIRRDKPVAEIDTLARVEEIYASQPELREQGTGLRD